MEAKETWEEFKERIFGTPYMIWHDGVGNDPDYYVRYHSADSYLKVNDLSPNGILDSHDIFPLICNDKEGENTPEVHERCKQAAEMLRALKT